MEAFEETVAVEGFFFLGGETVEVGGDFKAVVHTHEVGDRIDEIFRRTELFAVDAAFAGRHHQHAGDCCEEEFFHFDEFWMLSTGAAMRNSIARSSSWARGPGSTSARSWTIP